MSRSAQTNKEESSTRMLTVSKQQAIISKHRSAPRASAAVPSRKSEGARTPNGEPGSTRPKKNQRLTFKFWRNLWSRSEDGGARKTCVAETGVHSRPPSPHLHSSPEARSSPISLCGPAFNELLVLRGGGGLCVNRLMTSTSQMDAPLFTHPPLVHFLLYLPHCFWICPILPRPETSRMKESFSDGFRQSFSFFCFQTPVVVLPRGCRHDEVKPSIGTAFVCLCVCVRSTSDPQHSIGRAARRRRRRRSSVISQGFASSIMEQTHSRG